MSDNVSNGLLATNSENAFLLKFTVTLTTPLSQLIISFAASNSVLSIPDSAIAFVGIKLACIRFCISRIFDDQMHLNSKFV